MKRERILARKAFAADLAASDAALAAEAEQRRPQPTASAARPRLPRCGWCGSRRGAPYCSVACATLAADNDDLLALARDEAASGDWWRQEAS